ncbi:unnamed protein product [Haemonchus placei]|uniref:C2H2-type domain-containing protein n=1 Tax=Haemonchus placei TaxID=6290 RepID=A0A0N4WL05_HAEPC|nr:unnamed protein product [Haemonchus placei]
MLKMDVLVTAKLLVRNYHEATRTYRNLEPDVYGLLDSFTVRTGSPTKGSLKRPWIESTFARPDICLIIKRTHPEDGIERTELRLVTYQKAGAKADDLKRKAPQQMVLQQAHVLMEAARYLQDRADDAACDEDRGTGGRSRPISRGPSPCTRNLVRYFARRADESDDREWSTITGIAERLLIDVTDCIRKNKPISHGLLCRIKGLNETAKEATLQSQENRKRKKEITPVFIIAESVECWDRNVICPECGESARNLKELVKHCTSSHGGIEEYQVGKLSFDNNDDFNVMDGVPTEFIR